MSTSRKLIDSDLDEMLFKLQRAAEEVLEDPEGVASSITGESGWFVRRDLMFELKAAVNSIHIWADGQVQNEIAARTMVHPLESSPDAADVRKVDQDRGGTRVRAGVISPGFRPTLGTKQQEQEGHDHAELSREMGDRDRRREPPRRR